MASVTALKFSVVCAAVTGPAAALFAQTPPRPALTSHVGQFVDFQVLSGRITALPRRSGRSVKSMSRGVDRTESLAIHVQDNVPHIEYEFVSSSDELSIHLRSGNEVRMKYVAKSDYPKETEFVQAPGRPTELVVVSGGERRTYHGATLWHLMIREPEASGEHLVPLLEIFRPDWQLSSSAWRIEEVMFRTVESHSLPDPVQWSHLVEQLGSDDYGRREAADRRLREAGQSALHFLRGINREQLDAEQWFRVRRIMDYLHEQGTGDTPGRVAAWLSQDPQIWLVLLGRDDAEKRRLAAKQLSKLLGHPVDFDPEADVATRQQQLELVDRQIRRWRSAAAQSH